MPRVKNPAPPPPRRGRANGTSKALDKAADRFASFLPASAVLTLIQAVPTILPQLDHALRVGGWPIQRTALVHGPSNEGKTLLILALIYSFLLRGHRALHVDAERTTPITWPQKLMGPVALSPKYHAVRPDSFEDTVEVVRKFAGAMVEERKEDPEACGIVVVDSIKKLVPRDAWEAITADLKSFAEDAAKAKKRGEEITLGRDRMGQIKAKMNSAWMDELGPLVDKAGLAFVAIAREMKNPDADKWAKKSGWDFIIGGGGDLFFEASIAARVERKWIHPSGAESDSDGAKEVLGERHRVVVHKTKIAEKQDKRVVSFFHTSNGKVSPYGFDRPRDVLELAERLGVVTRSGNGWFTYDDDEKIGHGTDQTVAKLHQRPEFVVELEAACRALFDAPAVDFDPATGEVFDA